MNLCPEPPLHLEPRHWPGLTLYAATVLLEAESEPEEGQLAVAYVVRNRMDLFHEAAVDVMLKPWQFSCWNTDYAVQRRARLLGLDPVRWERAWRCACAAHWRLLPDPTDGATLYLNPELTRKIRPGGTLPSWYDSRRVTLAVGRHHFLTA